jgi:hypothetical protein
MEGCNDKHDVGFNDPERYDDDGTKYFRRIFLLCTSYTYLTSRQKLLGYPLLFNRHMHMQEANRAVEWVYSDGGGGGTAAPVWLVSVFVDGLCVGKGKGRTKKAARNEAAEHALQGLGIYE